MGVPGMAGLGLDVRETGAGRRIGNANEMLASRTLHLSAGVARVTLERLIAVRTEKFEFGFVHGGRAS